MGNGREALHAGLETLLRNELVSTRLVERNTDVPDDWETILAEHPGTEAIVIVRDGRWSRALRAGQTIWTHTPTIEGHVRRVGDTQIGTTSDTLLSEVVAIFDADDTLGGLCIEHELAMPEDPELNTEVPSAGSLMGWRIEVAAQVEETTDS